MKPVRRAVTYVVSSATAIEPKPPITASQAVRPRLELNSGSVSICT